MALKSIRWALSVFLITSVSLSQAKANSKTLPTLPQPDFSLNDLELFYNSNPYAPNFVLERSVPYMMKQVAKSAKNELRINFYIFGGPHADALVDIAVNKIRERNEARKMNPNLPPFRVRILLDRTQYNGRPEVANYSKKTLEKIKQHPEIELSLSTLAPMEVDSAKAGLDHNKFIVADTDTAEVGSTNLSPTFARYHDLAMRVRGPVALDLAKQFDFDWYNAAHPTSPIRGFVLSTGAKGYPTTVPKVESGQNQSYVRLVGAGIGRHTSITSLLALLESAKESIHIQMHEMGTDPKIMEVLNRKSLERVDVRIVLDPNDMATAHLDPDYPLPPLETLEKIITPKLVLNACFVEDILELQKSGQTKIRMRVYPTNRERSGFSLAHMKSVVVDGEKFFAGSTNWTYGGFFWVTETNLEVWGGSAPRRAEQNFTKDWTLSATNATEDGPLATANDYQSDPDPLALLACKIYRKGDPK